MIYMNVPNDRVLDIQHELELEARYEHEAMAEFRRTSIWSTCHAKGLDCSACETINCEGRK